MTEVIIINPVNQASTKKRVGAYARVSSDSCDQLESFTAQVAYYTKLIAANKDWELVDIYADEAITGLRADKRLEFQRLLKDCRKGKIDHILAKSISRFSRNTTDCLETIRELKSLGISLYFEKENLDTASITGEMMLAFFSNSAQEESMSISGNMRWSYAYRIKNGLFITCKAPYGYRLVKTTLIPDPTEAEVVRRIYRDYLAGKSVQAIADELTREKWPRHEAADEWMHQSIIRILKNEKYAGNALVQKTYSTDTLPFQKLRNKGEKHQYFITNSHQAIISAEDYESVQVLIRKRTERHYRATATSHPLSKMVRCGECGATLKRKINCGKIYWVCQNHNKNKNKCGMRQVPEDLIYTAITRMFRKLQRHGKKIFLPMIAQLQAVKTKTHLTNVKMIELGMQIAELNEQLLVLVRLNASGVLEQDLYMAQSNDINKRLLQLKTAKNRLVDDDDEDTTISKTQLLIDVIEEMTESIGRFDNSLFNSIVEEVTILSPDAITIKLINGLELIERLEVTA